MATSPKTGSIPVSNPTEALAFCRQLAAIVQQGGNDSSWLNAADIPTLSVVLPIFNEESIVTDLVERLIKTLTASGESFELIFVDDGSKDRSVELLTAISKREQRISVIQLARNFGQQVAFSAGLDFARGKAVVLMDADLQDPPEELPKFLSKWREGFDVVYAVRIQRKETLPMRLAYATFYRLLHGIANIDISIDSGDFCLMDRKVVNHITSMPERNRFVRGIRSWVGLNQTGIEVERHKRSAGKPKYNLEKLVYLALDGLISFSFVPLRLISIVGILVSMLSVFLAVFYLVKKALVGLEPPGFATLVVMMSFFAGTQLITLGVIGEYVGRIFEEVKQRPLYIVKNIVSSR